MIFAADATLPDPNSFSSIGWFIVIAIAVIVALNQVVQLIQSLKPKPSYEEQFAKRTDHADLRDEVTALKASNTGTHAQLFNKIAESEKGAREAIDRVRQELARDGERRKAEIIEAIHEVRDEGRETAKRVGTVELEAREATAWIGAQNGGN